MQLNEEIVFGGAGIFIGTITSPPEGEWLIQLQDVLAFIWPIVYGGLMALGTHIVKRLLNWYSSKNKNKNEK